MKTVDTSVDAALDAILARRTAEVGSLARTLRELVRGTVPKAQEVIYHSALCYGMSERRSSLKVYISFHTSHVNLGFYRGAGLPDGDGLLEGDGKQMRHIKIKGPRDVKRRPFQKLVKASLAQE